MIFILSDKFTLSRGYFSVSGQDFWKVDLFLGRRHRWMLKRVIRYDSLGYFTLFTLLCVGLSCGGFGIVEESYGG